MAKETKITLSSKELELVCNRDWILTKHIIIDKVYKLFGKLAVSMQERVQQIASTLPREAAESNPKISRGENYQGLPYVMLDYPRHFTKEFTLAIRTFFWWGNFFSINLHLSGGGKQAAAAVLSTKFTSLQQGGYWLCTHADPWQHHFESENYVPLTEFSAADFEAVLANNPFIKIGKQIPIKQWDDAGEFLEKTFYEMILLLQISFPGDEKDLLPGIPITGFGL